MLLVVHLLDRLLYISPSYIRLTYKTYPEVEANIIHWTISKFKTNQFFLFFFSPPEPSYIPKTNWSCPIPLCPQKWPPTSPWKPHAALHSIPENRLGRSFVASAPPTRHKSSVNLSSVVKMRDPAKTRKPRPSSVATSMPSFVRVETDTTPKSSRSKSTERTRRGSCL